MSSVEHQIAEAIRGVFASSAYAKESRHYVGVEVMEYRAEDATFSLEIRFLNGHRYCCFEPGCHFSGFSSGWWRRLRAELERMNIGDIPKLQIRDARVVVEDGALWGMRGPDDDRPLKAADTYTYTVDGTAEPLP